MSTTTVSTPDADEACAYCGSRIFEHDPICVRDCEENCGSPAYFCELPHPTRSPLTRFAP